MKLITRNTDYALRALLYLAGSKEKIVSVSELVAKLQMPRPFTRKILQIMQRHGILSSIKGNKGGFALAKPIDKIYLVDLIMIFQGEFKIVDCLLKKKICPDIKGCPLRQELVDVEKYVKKRFQRVTLKSLLKQN